MSNEMIELPHEAGNWDESPFDPDDDWLRSAPPEQQIVAMRRWFTDRYEDPANETPWDGEDKAYVFVWGGPYDPNDEIQSRFGGVVPHDVMWELITDLWREVGDEWAPIEHEGADFDDYASHLVVTHRQDPYELLRQRLEEITSIVQGGPFSGPNRRLLHQMAHSSLIAAIEAYLADTVIYWTEAEDAVLRRFVSTNKDFQSRTFSLAEIFERSEKLKEDVKSYLVDFVWHRLDKVKPMLASGLGIKVPDIGDLTREVILRHDIVHRAGRRADGTVVDLEVEDLERVSKLILSFADGMESELLEKFPPLASIQDSTSC